MDENTPWKNLGTIGLRFIDLVVRYAIIFTVTWVLGAALLHFPDLEPWPFLLMVGAPSVLLSFVYGLSSTRPEGEFRGRLAGLLLLPLVPWFPVFFYVPLLPVLVAAQMFFVLGGMRAPFLGPSQLRRLARAAVARLAGRHRNVTQVTTKG